MSESKRAENIVAKLSPEEARAFRVICACDTACERMVRAVVHESEQASMASAHVWREVARRHGLSLSTLTYHVSADGEHIVESSPTDRITRRYDDTKAWAESLLRRADSDTGCGGSNG